MSNYDNQTESLYLSNDFPLDKKTRITSLTNLAEEIPLYHRYLGLIFYVIDIKKFYTFKNDINNAETLLADNEITNTFGIYVEQYVDIPTELNKYTTLGKVIFVFPLNVAFYYDGTTWKYYSGIYNLRTNVDLNNLSVNLKNKGSKVIKDNILYIWNHNNTLSEYVTVTNTNDNLVVFNNPALQVEDRYYKHRNQLYRVVSGSLWKIGSKVTQTNNFNIIQGNTKIAEISVSQIGESALPPYINAKLWIYDNINITTNQDVLIPINLSIFYILKNQIYEIWAVSDTDYVGTLEIQY